MRSVGDLDLPAILGVRGILLTRAGTGPGQEDSADAEDRWQVEVTHRSHSSQETAYRMTMTRCRLAPTYLSCSDGKPKAEIRYDATAFARVR
jgi:hypothetical protein